jgi:hypothetical protein
MRMIVVTDASAIGELVRLVLSFYLTIATMGIGFAIMFAGGNGASAPARFFFVAPIHWVVSTITVAVGGIIALLWSGALRVIGKGLGRELKELAADLRWFVRGR